MTQALIIVTIPFAPSRSQQVTAALDDLRNRSMYAVARTLDQAEFVHFASMSVVHERNVEWAHLVLELSADGAADRALQRFARAIESALLSVLHAAGAAVSPESLGVFLEEHRLKVGPGWSPKSGVLFFGTPGLSVQRIGKEDRLAHLISRWLDGHPAVEPALTKLERIRGRIFERADLKWALQTDRSGLAAQATRSPARLILSGLRDLGWPLLILPFIVACISAFSYGRPPDVVAGHFAIALGVELLIAVLVAGAAVRLQEIADKPVDRAPLARHDAQLMVRENRCAQNHVLGVSTLKPARRAVLRFVFWLVEYRAKHSPKPGYLSDIGTIHFASWFLLPRTRQLIFLSNYDGSWLSYLEDFIAQAHYGLTGIWSNTRGFPKTRWLFFGGAHDAERFKRWSRRQQRLTGFWYSAYPDLTAERIRRNAAIRRGLVAASNEAAAAEWLSLFGFAPDRRESPAGRPARERSRSAKPTRYPSQISTHNVKPDCAQIPTLAFGGLTPLPCSHALIIALRDDPQECRAWLRRIEGDLTYGPLERKPVDGVVAVDGVVPVARVVGFTQQGLRKIGLSASALAMFPSAFQHGMDAPWRARALGDAGPSIPSNWLWGARHAPCDAFMMLYAKDPGTLQNEVRAHTIELVRRRHRILRSIALSDLTPGQPVREPFGFIDGVSQPVVRGLHDERRRRGEIHLIEPGEIVLGYPDNNRYVAPTPKYRGSDIGMNGSFLVVRQLQQDPQAFENYLDATGITLAAASINGDPRVPSRDAAWLKEWIAAKMIGRWRVNATSLVRHPDNPGMLSADNDFRFGEDDPHGLRCPFSAHIRRANPRDSLQPQSPQQIDITNKHRILRVGRVYDGPRNSSTKPGLLFMCVNANIEAQFEFLQQTWVLGRSFHGLRDESDYIVGRRRSSRGSALSIPTQHGPLHLRRMQDFVTVLGGGYFFMPSRATLHLLASS